MVEQDRLFNDDVNLTSLESHGDDEITFMTNILQAQGQ